MRPTTLSGMGAGEASPEISAGRARTRPWRRRPRPGSRPAYKPHTAVDDLSAVLGDVVIVTGENHDAGRFDPPLAAIEDTFGVAPNRITADAVHGLGRARAALEDHEIEAIIPSRRATRRKGRKAFRPSGSGSTPITPWSALRRTSG